jgi:hypothetical protein
MFKNKEIKMSSSTMQDIKLLDVLKSATLWGSVDGERTRNFLITTIKNSQSRIIDIDLRGIKDCDTLFLESAFFDVAKNLYEEYSGQRALVFTIAEEDDIEFRLSDVFKKNNSCIVFRRNNSYEVSGAASYGSKLIMHKLLNYSPIAPEIVCEEIGGSKNENMLEFTKLQQLGIAEKTSGDLYTSPFRLKSIKDSARYFFKKIKIRFARKPLYTFFK